MDPHAQLLVEKMMSEYRDVKHSHGLIELSTQLKFEGLAGSGGAGKTVVAAGQVLLNGHVDTQPRKKVMAGDTREFAGQRIRVYLPTQRGYAHHEVTGMPI